MANCSDFLRDYSEYRDGLIDPAGRAELDAHLAGCSRCARYDRVVSKGVGELKSLPQLEPSYDFIPRLEHRLFHVQDDRSWWGRPDTSATSVGFALLLVLLIGAAAWVPTLNQKVPLVELPPVAAAAPASATEVHTLFREGPLLQADRGVSPLPHRGEQTVFFRYTRLGGGAVYPTSLAAPR